jgi:ketosteroid isomerase-like protein
LIGDPRLEIQERNHAYVGVFNRHEAELLVADFFAEGCVLLPPGTAPVRGHQAVIDYWRGEFAQGVRLGSLNTIEVLDCEVALLELGSYELDWADGRRGSGHYGVLWNRDKAGVLRVAMDIWNVGE